jgi:hypothetical protein
LLTKSLNNAAGGDLSDPSVDRLRWLAAPVTTDDGQFAPANGDKLSVRTEYIPGLIPGGIRNELQSMAGAESEFQVQKPWAQFQPFHCCPHEAAVHFAGRIHRRRKTKLGAVICAGHSYAPTFDQAPQTRDDEVGLGVERDKPIILTPRERVKPMSDKPRQFIHRDLHGYG